MTKRQAGLAAAAKLSTKTNATNNSNQTAKKKTTGPAKTKKPTSKAKASTVLDNNLPWYTVYTKSDPEYDTYMSTEWGKEKRGDVPLFEKICLEGAQSGLSWQTILRKRDAYRRTFHNYEIDKVAKMTPEDVQTILDTTTEDPRDMVVRHRGKIEATIHNAKCVQAMYEEEKGDTSNGFLLDRFLWSFVQDKPILNTKWKQGESIGTAPATSPESEAMSKALKKRGFRFVGPTTCYAMMQSVGMVIDHPHGSPEWHAAVELLEKRPGGYQKDVDRVVEESKEPPSKRSKISATKGKKKTSTKSDGKQSK